MSTVTIVSVAVVSDCRQIFDTVRGISEIMGIVSAGCRMMDGS
jgi:hypothetical protein